MIILLPLPLWEERGAGFFFFFFVIALNNLVVFAIVRVNYTNSYNNNQVRLELEFKPHLLSVSCRFPAVACYYDYFPFKI